MTMNLKLSLAVTPSQAPTRPSAVVTWGEREALILTKWSIDVINMQDVDETDVGDVEDVGDFDKY